MNSPFCISSRISILPAHHTPGVVWPNIKESHSAMKNGDRHHYREKWGQAPLSGRFGASVPTEICACPRLLMSPFTRSPRAGVQIDLAGEAALPRLSSRTQAWLKRNGDPGPIRPASAAFVFVNPGPSTWFRRLSSGRTTRRSGGEWSGLTASASALGLDHYDLAVLQGQRHVAALELERGLAKDLPAPA